MNWHRYFLNCFDQKKLFEEYDLFSFVHGITKLLTFFKGENMRLMWVKRMQLKFISNVFNLVMLCEIFSTKKLHIY